jgi:hypothetical protein
MEGEKLIKIKGIKGDQITLIENSDSKPIESEVKMVNPIFASVPNKRYLTNKNEVSKIFLICDINSIAYFGVRTESGDEYLIDSKTIDNYEIE